MFEKLFGKKEDKAESAEKTRSSSQSPSSATPVQRQGSPVSASPAPDKSIEMRPAQAKGPVLHVSDDAVAAEARARTAMAAIHAAVAPPATPKFDLPDDAGVREQAAAYFSAGEHKRTIDMLVSHLNKTAGNAPKSIWFMLMDAYQALGQQAAFEKSAWLFADFFKTSPPSWEAPSAGTSVPPSTGPSMGRNVLVVDGLPSRAHPEKIKDYVQAAREAKHAKLDLSRTRLDEDHAQRSDDLKVLLQLMRRLRRYQVPTLLMGENQLVEVLRTVIQQDLPVPQADLYWELLLEFLQWRGQEDAFEDLAISFARKFGRSAPGYEPTDVVALAPDDQSAQPPAHSLSGLEPSPTLDDSAMEAWCDRLAAEFAMTPPSLDQPLRVEFHHVRTVSFSAAGILASRLSQWAWPIQAVVFAGPSELVSALFDITGVSGLVHILPRKR